MTLIEPDLNKLARKIREHHETNVASANDVRGKLMDALNEAVLCGKALEEARLVLGEKFASWVALHCGSMQWQQATAYLRIAKRKDKRQIVNDYRQTFLPVVIDPPKALPESTETPSGEVTPDAPQLERITRPRRELDKQAVLFDLRARAKALTKDLEASVRSNVITQAEAHEIAELFGVFTESV